MMLKFFLTRFLITPFSAIVRLLGMSRLQNTRAPRCMRESHLHHRPLCTLLTVELCVRSSVHGTVELHV